MHKALAENWTLRREFSVIKVSGGDIRWFYGTNISITLMEDLGYDRLRVLTLARLPLHTQRFTYLWARWPLHTNVGIARGWADLVIPPDRFYRDLRYVANIY